MGLAPEEGPAGQWGFGFSLLRVYIGARHWACCLGCLWGFLREEKRSREYRCPWDLWGIETGFNAWQLDIFGSSIFFQISATWILGRLQPRNPGP